MGHCEVSWCSEWWAIHWVQTAALSAVCTLPCRAPSTAAALQQHCSSIVCSWWPPMQSTEHCSSWRWILCLLAITFTFTQAATTTTNPGQSPSAATKVEELKPHTAESWSLHLNSGFFAFKDLHWQVVLGIFPNPQAASFLQSPGLCVENVALPPPLISVYWGLCMCQCPQPWPRVYTVVVQCSLRGHQSWRQSKVVMMYDVQHNLCKCFTMI